MSTPPAPSMAVLGRCSRVLVSEHRRFYEHDGRATRAVHAAGEENRA